ncbi:MAG: FHA domain-containing protein [Gemmatimonadetes bacterium]|nr:FHA domain-containing protein [Gemmatimonadota bacterium]
MAYLKLRNTRSGEILEFEQDEVRIGRAPDLDLTLDGPGCDGVSGNHAVMAFRDGAWTLEDTGSTNGTFLDQQQLTPREPLPLRTGSTLGIGTGGPRFRVEMAGARKLASTVVQGQPGISTVDKTVPMDGLPEGFDAPGQTGPEDATTPMTPTTDTTIALTLRDARTGEDFTSVGGRIRIGRGRECEIRPVKEGDTTVSRVHAEIVLKPDGVVVLRDARSRNGTVVNGQRITTEYPLKEGDRISLGNDGPQLLVARLEGGRPPPITPVPAGDMGSGDLSAPEEARRSFGGKGRTRFVKDLVESTAQKSHAKVRAVVWGFTILLAGGLGALWWYSEQMMRDTEAALALQRQVIAEQRVIADSVQAAAEEEYNRLRQDLNEARAASAPAVVVDSLRDALVEAQRRTLALEASLGRAQNQLNTQLAHADSLRRIRETELQGLRAEMVAASNNRVPQELIDSLRQAVRDAEEQITGIEGQLRAVSGVDLATVAQANQGAVGLVSVYRGGRVYDGSGFVITPSGYFVTNRHVVMQDGRRADSVFVTMADQRRMIRSDIVSLASAEGADVALLRIRNYTGPHVPRVDWNGTKARQGEPAALIGFPAGLAAALDRTQTIRTSMSGGIFSQVTKDEIRFDGFTVGGSSGSPILNASGDVVGIHRAGLADAVGMSFAVPIRLVIPLLPADARAAVGIR